MRRARSTASASSNPPGLPFGGHVALDVAARGQSLNGKDLDNLVHTLLVPFEQEVCASRGTVVGYRAY